MASIQHVLCMHGPSHLHMGALHDKLAYECKQELSWQQCAAHLFKQTRKPVYCVICERLVLIRYQQD